MLYQITGKSFALTEHEDRFGIGADFTILTPDQILDEAINFWPGIAVATDGYVPVAYCDTGSGDYYYINSNDGSNSCLYRIYHDQVSEVVYSNT